ncbi:MAG TPA: hypothetical protein VHS78_13270 [Candidatus Elarobacter sp.]|nr:hypothetical protein [Candidatus Elarobacter sp.]
MLTVRVGASGSEVRIGGILRAYFSLHSLHGWALVPPRQHGGFATARLTELPIAEATEREVVLGGFGRVLRFTENGELVFELEREREHPILTPPPRVVRNQRYLYVGGRRRRAAEPWMLR